ncbi:PH domain-containing protein [Mucilaginibacter terrae]|uniref:Uncharacterized protein YyaB-like PH domain-containing protein n=1 Tax=Mucilaginibacter terrae TaxID=1955052 RepID=A0ABU3GXT3_9SPHI|nr:PH domain-containing protein [Mucilaginibacter terrae]MDT3404584.1 hypothetical protein [Mucilaginibacter terrae]
MRFYSAKSTFVSIVIGAAVALMFLQVYIVIDKGGPKLLLLVFATVCTLLLWMWFATYYDVEDNLLYYRSGPINGKIDINTIRKIEVGKTQYVGLKPALASKGCVVHYNKYDDIYLSPKDKDGFIAALLKVNPTIEVVANK